MSSDKVSKEVVMRILRGLSSKFLSCGCLAGVYETYDGDQCNAETRHEGSNHSAVVAEPGPHGPTRW